MADPVVSADVFAVFTEGDSGVVLSPNLTVTDADSANLTGAVISISDYLPGDYLAFVDQNGITGVFDEATGVLTLTGVASVADYQAALRSIEYVSVSEPNVGQTDNTRALSFVVSDGTTTGQDAMGILISDGGGPGAGADVVSGTPVADHIDGLAGDDTISGGGGDDYLKGGLGADAMSGGTGDDTYIVDDLGDTTDETGGDGTDKVHVTVDWTLGTDFENLTLAAPGGDIDGTGNGLDNVILGNSFANTLSGLAGADTLTGDGGNDVLNGGDDDDSLDGGGQNDVLNGGAGADDLVGGIGNDSLDGGTGADDMAGGAGHDAYVVDDIGDTVTEGAGAGTDTVTTSVSFDLGNNVENLTVSGGADTNHFGNALRNTMTGGNGANYFSAGAEADTLAGGDGDDGLVGGTGNDVLNGGAGADTLTGEQGDDRMTGGTGADVFLFWDFDVARSGLGQSAWKDTITDIDFAGGDIIDLSGIDANALTVGDDAFTFVSRFTGVAGQATMSFAGGVTLVRLDVDGDRQPDLIISLQGDQRASATDVNATAADGGWYL